NINISSNGSINTTSAIQSAGALSISAGGSNGNISIGTGDLNAATSLSLSPGGSGTVKDLSSTSGKLIGGASIALSGTSGNFGTASLPLSIQSSNVSMATSGRLA